MRGIRVSNRAACFALIGRDLMRPKERSGPCALAHWGRSASDGLGSVSSVMARALAANARARKAPSVRKVQPHGPRGGDARPSSVVGTLVPRIGAAEGEGATKAAAGRVLMPIFAPSSIRARTRLPVAGWVENRLSAPLPFSGLMMNIWAVAGLRSAGAFTAPRA